MNAKFSLPLVFLASVVAPQLAFAGQSFPLTTQTLSSWTVTGVDREQLAAASVVTLPAGSQLARTFGSGDVAVNLDASVVFGSESLDWPVLEVGSAAIVFMRNGADGTLKLIAGEHEPITLPYLFKLDASGRSVDSVGLTVIVARGVVAINAQHQTESFPTDLMAGVKTEVVFSAGNSSDLSLTTFEVILDAHEASSADASNGYEGNTSFDTEKTNSTGNPNVGTGSVTGHLSGANAASASSGKVDDVAASKRGKVGLVVFSRSAFRLGRADAIRSTVSSIAGRQK